MKIVVDIENCSSLIIIIIIVIIIIIIIHHSSSLVITCSSSYNVRLITIIGIHSSLCWLCSFIYLSADLANL